MVSSGTAALHLALLALEIGPGDEVIVPAYTFPATANAVELCGARAVLVDVDPDTFVVDPAAVAAAVTPRTRAVMAVHLFGRPVEWEALQTAVPQEVVLLEDAAGALGARYRGDAVRRARRRRLPLVPPAQDRDDRRGRSGDDGRGRARRRCSTAQASRLGDARRDARAGVQLPPADLLCAIGIPQLARLEELLAARERVARWYTERLEHHVLTPSAAEGDRHGWQAYVVQLDRRDDALAALRGAGIEAQIGNLGAAPARAVPPTGVVPGADRAFERALALPLATTTTEAEVERVAEVLTSIVSEC